MSIWADMAAKDPKRFALVVKAMRDNGVASMDGLVLGDAPREQAPRDKRPEPETALEKQHKVMFAASRFRPPLPEPTAPVSNVPKALVQRRERNEAARGREARKG